MSVEVEPRHTSPELPADVLPRPQSKRFVWLSNQHVLPLGIIVCCVLAVNFPALVHVVTTNPIQLYGDLQIGTPQNVLAGQPIIDPNAGFVTQSLGHLVASDWFKGQLPWWNPYEGIGSPLAGEMQSAAFFPLTFLLDGTWGFVLFHLVLELVAGTATYFLLRRLGTGRYAATAGGVAFGLCGTFAWFAHAPANPICFLPLALLGVERCVEATRLDRRGGWLLVAVSLALSFVAGFPEVAYIDGLLVLVWAVLRGWSLGKVRARYALKLVFGATLAVMLAAPTLVAFGTYLPNASVGGHSGSFGNNALVPQALPQLILPYVHGTIFGLTSAGTPNTFNLIWGNVGGFLSASLVVCALVGIVGSRLRNLRVALALWIAVFLAKTYGLQPVAHLITYLPLFHSIATYRYSPSSWELATIVLAALGIDDVLKGLVSRRVLLTAAGTAVVLIFAAMIAAWPSLTSSVGSPHPHLFDLVSGLWALTTVGLIVFGGLLIIRQRRPDESWADDPHRPTIRQIGSVLITGGLILDVVVLFAFPLLSAPTPLPIDVGVVQWLQNHLGTERFTTLGPIAPNFGSYFGLAEVNVNDLPIPSAYETLIEHRLDDNVDPLIFTGTTSLRSSGPTPSAELTDHLNAYETLGVKFVVVGAGGTDVDGVKWPSSVTPGVRLVYKDADALVYELPHPASLFSTLDSRCDIHGYEWDEVSLTCPRATSLVRRELSLPGWTATVTVPTRHDAYQTPVRTTNGVFQEVSVPRGTAIVRFSFAPPYSDYALAACAIGLLVLLGFAVAWMIRQVRSSSKGGGSPAGP